MTNKENGGEKDEKAGEKEFYAAEHNPILLESMWWSLPVVRVHIWGGETRQKNREKKHYFWALCSTWEVKKRFSRLKHRDEA